MLGRAENALTHPVPKIDTPVRFATFTDAANEAALSRLLGGIHFQEDNTIGLAAGRLIDTSGRATVRERPSTSTTG